MASVISGELRIEPNHRATDQRHGMRNTSGIQRVSGGEIVCAVQRHIHLRHVFMQPSCICALRKNVDVNVRVERLHGLTR